MEANQISIHILSSDISVGDVDTGESICDFLENQMDERKYLVSSFLRFKVKIWEFVDDFLHSFDSREQWELLQLSNILNFLLRPTINNFIL